MTSVMAPFYSLAMCAFSLTLADKGKAGCEHPAFSLVQGKCQYLTAGELCIGLCAAIRDGLVEAIVIIRWHVDA